MKYCVECGSVLHEQFIVTEISFIKTGVLISLYCMNGNCSRRGLLSKLFVKEKLKKEIKK